MVRISLISDTHGYLCDRTLELLNDCDEIWHAGDIGSLHLLERLEETRKPLRIVHGNIDGGDVRLRVPATQRFVVEGLDVMITHIGGYPGKYEPHVRAILLSTPPKLLVCGHSHILKVMNDKRHDMLYMNPGAVGKYGFHMVRTMLLFDIDQGACKNLRVMEWEK